VRAINEALDAQILRLEERAKAPEFTDDALALRFAQQHAD
jgi:hypothetical protein